MVATMLRVAPDAVVHQLTDLSATDSAANARLRIHGTRNLVDAAHAAGVRRMVAQSIAWAYAPGDGPAAEDVAARPGGRAAAPATIDGVAALEAAVGELPAGVVLRYGLLYGPGTWYAPGARCTVEARAGRLPADDDVTSFLHVDDAATAAADALEWPPGPVNVCDDEPAAGREWVPALCAEIGAPSARPSARAPDAVGPGRRQRPRARARLDARAPQLAHWVRPAGEEPEVNHCNRWA